MDSVKVKVKYFNNFYWMVHHPTPKNQVHVITDKAKNSLGWLPMSMVRGKKVKHIIPILHKARHFQYKWKSYLQEEHRGIKLKQIGTDSSDCDTIKWCICVKTKTKNNTVQYVLGSYWELPFAYTRREKLVTRLQAMVEKIEYEQAIANGEIPFR
jgi:hypothetical protein